MRRAFQKEETTSTKALGKSEPRMSSGQQGGQRGQIIQEREQESLDQVSSCGEGTKQWDSRCILKAELERGESEEGTHRFWSG